MKVALVVPRDPPGLNNFNQVPIGTLYTAGALRQAGVDVDFHDLRVGFDNPEAYKQIAGADLALVVAHDYDLAQCYPSLAPAAACIARIKQAGDAAVVCAGSHATIEPAMTIRYTGADGVVRGEFEFAVPDLVQHLSVGNPCPEVWPRDGVATATVDWLAHLSAPAYDLATMSHYASEGFVDGELERVNSGLVLANRGCPFACSFCYLLFGRRLRGRPVEATIAEITAMHRDHGIDHFFFLDYTFTIDASWVGALCDAIDEAGLDISWVCQTRVDCLDEDMLLRMRRSGCEGVWLGVESPDLEQRRYLGKGRIGIRDIEAGVELIRECGLHVLAFVMVGLPNETEPSLRAMNRWLEYSKVYYSLSTFQRRLGTPLARKEDMAPSGWEYLDETSPFLGQSELRLDELGWFFEFHDTSPYRVKNVMRQRLAARD